MLEKWEPRYDELVQACYLIREFIEDYYAARGLVWPDENEAILFLGSEFGEACDILVSDQATWIRNNPNKLRHDSFSSELGDVIMMAMVAAISDDNCNALLALVNKCMMKCKEMKNVQGEQ